MDPINPSPPLYKREVSPLSKKGEGDFRKVCLRLPRLLAYPMRLSFLEAGLIDNLFVLIV
jgi:hypothetical protein